jgi:hypothetical protein
MSLRQLKNSAIKIHKYFQKNILQTRIHDGGTIRNIAVELGVSTSTVLRAGLFSRIFSIFLNQIKAQRDQKMIVWIEYFPYKYLQF